MLEQSYNLTLVALNTHMLTFSGLPNLLESRKIQWHRTASPRSVHFADSRKLSRLGKRFVRLELEPCILNRHAASTHSASALALM